MTAKLKGRAKKRHATLSCRAEYAKRLCRQGLKRLCAGRNPLSASCKPVVYSELGLGSNRADSLNPIIVVDQDIHRPTSRHSGHANDEGARILVTCNNLLACRHPYNSISSYQNYNPRAKFANHYSLLFTPSIIPDFTNWG